MIDSEVVATIRRSLDSLLVSPLAAFGTYLHEVVLVDHPTTIPAEIKVLAPPGYQCPAGLTWLRREEGVDYYLYPIAGSIPLAVTIAIHTELLPPLCLEEKVLYQDGQLLGPAQSVANLRARRLTLDPEVFEYGAGPKVERMQELLAAGWEVRLNDELLPIDKSFWWYWSKLGKPLPPSLMWNDLAALLVLVGEDAQLGGRGLWDILVRPQTPVRLQLRTKQDAILRERLRRIPWCPDEYYLETEGVVYGEIHLNPRASEGTVLFEEERLIWRAAGSGAREDVTMDHFPGRLTTEGTIPANELVANLLAKRLQLCLTVDPDESDQVRAEIEKFLAAGWRITLAGFDLGPVYQAPRHREILASLRPKPLDREALRQRVAQLEVLVAELKRELE